MPLRCLFQRTQSVIPRLGDSLWCMKGPGRHRLEQRVLGRWGENPGPLAHHCTLWLVTWALLRVISSSFKWAGCSKSYKVFVRPESDRLPCPQKDQFKNVLPSWEFCYFREWFLHRVRLCSSLCTCLAIREMISKYKVISGLSHPSAVHFSFSLVCPH